MSLDVVDRFLFFGDFGDFGALITLLSSGSVTTATIAASSVFILTCFSTVLDGRLVGVFSVFCAWTSEFTALRPGGT